MALFDFLRPRPHSHPVFGPLQHARGRWRGAIMLERDKRVPLFVHGSRTAPSPEALRTAERVPEWWTRARPQVETELFEHYEAGRDAGVEGIPALASRGEIWPHVTLSSVEIQPSNHQDEIQVALRVPWDEEHTLGALVRDGQLIGLNGSILEPR